MTRLTPGVGQNITAGADLHSAELVAERAAAEVAEQVGRTPSFL
jgi:hypothetical protein